MIGRCGKLPKVEDERNLQLVRYLEHRTVRESMPLTRCWSKQVDRWGMFLNDRLGCCTVSAACHAIQTWSAHAGRPFMVSNADVENAYRAISGYDGRPETDQGATANALLKRFRTEGIGGVKILCWYELDPQDHFEVAATIDLCGGVYAGFQLPTTIQHEDVWASTLGRPGSLGGHAMWVTDRMFNTRNAPSWRELRRMTLEFCSRFCDEAYGLVSELWLGPDLRAPNGLRLDEIMHDMRLVTA